MIPNQIVILARLAKELNGTEAAGLERRIILQKKIHLLQSCGVQLGYAFVWDLYGPYSKTLAHDIAALEEEEEEIEETAAELNLTDWAKEQIERVLHLAEIPSHAHIPSGAWVELVSSLIYLAEHHFKNSSIEDRAEKVQQVNKSLLAAKPHLRQYKDTFQEAWKRIVIYVDQSSALPVPS